MSEHRISVDNDTQQIVIDRIYASRPPVLYTSLLFDEALAVGFDEFARKLGENLILDSPELRALFKL